MSIETERQLIDRAELVKIIEKKHADYERLQAELADALEQAQARIAELEDGLIKEREICTEYIEQRNALALRVKELEGEVERKMSAGQYLIEQNTALALQVEQQAAAIERRRDWFSEELERISKGNGSPFDYMSLLDEREAATKALSTAPASEIIAAHDAKVIELCAVMKEALIDVLDALGAISKPYELEGYGIREDRAVEICALIAAPKPGESKEVG